MQQLGEMARSWRKEPGLKFTDVVAGALNPVSYTHLTLPTIYSV